MVQQNMFPQEDRTSNQPPRSGKAAQGVNTNRPAVTPQNRPTQVQPAPKEDAQNGNRNAVPVVTQNQPVRLSGRVGRYIEVKQTATGKSLAKFSMATLEPYRDESGNWAKRTVWQRIVAWGETAESLRAQLEKGVRVSVEGQFKTREWVDRENNLHTTTELVARQVQFLDAAAA